MLKYSQANAKIHALSQVEELQKYLENSKRIYSFDLLSGWSCPGAKECLSKVHKIRGKSKLKDGPDTKIRCFSASQEISYPNVYNLRSGNYSPLKAMSRRDNAVDIITDNLQSYMPENLGICRIHVAGDFFHPSYMEAWINVARNNRDKLFYAYTKSLPFWIRFKPLLRRLSNFVLTASYGGRYDSLIKPHNLRHSTVIFHPSQSHGLPIDHDDSFASRPSKRRTNFALLLHGVQPAKSDASKALQILRKEGVQHAYSKKAT